MNVWCRLRQCGLITSVLLLTACGNHIPVALPGAENAPPEAVITISANNTRQDWLSGYYSYKIRPLAVDNQKVCYSTARGCCFSHSVFQKQAQLSTSNPDYSSVIEVLTFYYPRTENPLQMHPGHFSPQLAFKHREYYELTAHLEPGKQYQISCEQRPGLRGRCDNLVIREQASNKNVTKYSKSLGDHPSEQFQQMILPELFSPKRWYGWVNPVPYRRCDGAKPAT